MIYMNFNSNESNEAETRYFLSNAVNAYVIRMPASQKKYVTIHIATILNNDLFLFAW